MRNFIPRIGLIFTLALTACTSTQCNIGDSGSLAGLQSMANCGNKALTSKGKMSNIREMAIRETALSLGAQSGLAWRSKIIDDELTNKARQLDTIFNFNGLIIGHNILPPVLLEGRNTFNLANNNTIRLSDRTYKIAKQARFITRTPTWRQYLWMDYTKPENPNVSLLPKNKDEQNVWHEYVAKGWNKGINQANIILEENLARVKEDFRGMILYRKLLAMNMVSPPYVSETSLGVTGDGNEIHIDDRVLRITALPSLNINSKEWRAALAKNKNQLERFKKMEKLAKESKITITSKAWQPVIAPVN